MNCQQIYGEMGREGTKDGVYRVPPAVCMGLMHRRASCLHMELGSPTSTAQPQLGLVSPEHSRGDAAALGDSSSCRDVPPRLAANPLCTTQLLLHLIAPSDHFFNACSYARVQQRAIYSPSRCPLTL